MQWVIPEAHTLLAEWDPMEMSDEKFLTNRFDNISEANVFISKYFALETTVCINLFSPF